MVAIGQNLAAHGVFGHPFAETIDTGPTAVVPPLYPALIGILIRLFGGSAAWFILSGGVILMQALSVSLLPRLSRMFFDDARPGVCAAILCILLPVYSWMPYWDAMYAAAGLMLFCVASKRLLDAGGSRFTAAMLTGFFSGFLALMNPATLFVSVPWIVFAASESGKRWSWKERIRLAGCCAAAMTLMVLPWSLRNYSHFGTLSLKTNLGMTLFASNNDCASSSLLSELISGCYAAHHPYGSLAEAELLKSTGEAGYDRYRIAATMDWVRAHPGRFAGLTLRRIAEFWFPNPGYGVYVLGIWVITAISIPGLFLMRRNPVLKYLGAVFLLHPCLYYVVVSDYRYRYPILWLSLLPAGYAISAALIKLRLLKQEPLAD